MSAVNELGPLGNGIAELWTAFSELDPRDFDYLNNVGL